ncbi:MAG: hypothetical protein RR636_12945 [Clostridium sp.]|uniref:hypothetical protein n=1 Tax=Clostridium sp. TaxID=1506 RepID=UPI003217D091
MNKMSSEKEKLEMKVGQLHREVMAKGIPLIIIFQGKFKGEEKKIINSILSIMDYRVTKLHTDNSKETHKNQNKNIDRVKEFWINIPKGGNTSIFYTDNYFGLMDNRKNLEYIRIFEESLIQENYIIIKFIFEKNRNKNYGNNIEFIKAATVDKSCFKQIDLENNHNIIEVYEELIEKLTKAKTQGRTIKSENIKRDIDKKDFLKIETLTVPINKKVYIKRIKELEISMYKLQKQLVKKKKSLIIVYEGWDASGKGGNIGRVVKRLDPTLYKVIPICAPTEEEKSYHYMWRFWKWVPENGNIVIFDRSWYGRVLVEQVEELCEPYKWEKAYDEINMFEEYITDNNYILIKIFLNISNKEQLKRFNRRQNNPLKSYKITQEDWRNREKWDKYKDVINKCIDITSKDYNPWVVIDGDLKYNARVEALDYICKVLKKNL